MDGVDSTVAHLTKFYDSVRTRKEPFENALIGHQCATVGHMVDYSHRDGTLVRWNGKTVTTSGVSATGLRRRQPATGIGRRDRRRVGTRHRWAPAASESEE